MISESCSIEQFVETVKDKSTFEVLSLAVEEANLADRRYYRTKQENSATYSRQLKRLIAYLRYSVVPKRPRDKAYNLYMTHWGTPSYIHPDLNMDQQTLLH
jgi:hypothetical protein